MAVVCGYWAELLLNERGVAKNALVHMERTSLSDSDHPGSGFLFEGFRLSSEGALFRGDQSVDLTESESKVLLELVTHAGQVVTNLQLRRTVQVTEVSQEIPQLVESLKEQLEIAGCIETVNKLGYRFCCDVKTCSSVAGTTLQRLAILPVEAGAGVPAYLAEALTDETGRQLRLLAAGALRVLEQDSVCTLAKRQMMPAQIASAMRADLVLKGTLRALPGCFRLRVEMLRGSDVSPLWGEDLVLAEGRMIALARELAQRINVRTGGGVSIEASSDAMQNPRPEEAYELLWRAHSEWRTLQRHQMQDGLQRLQRAVELAPQWIEARVELVNLCAHQAIYGFMAPMTAADIIRRNADGARDKGAEALLPPLGWVHFHVDRNLHAALSAFESSAHLPHDRWISRLRAMFALSRHRFNEAIEILEASLSLDPYSGGLHARLAWAHHLAGDSEESVRRIEYALVEFPDHELTNLYAALTLAYNGEAERAVAIAEELVRRCPYLDPAMSGYAYALVCAGRREEAKALLEQLEWLSRERFVLRAFTPAVHVALGDHEAAMEELRVSDRSRCPWFFQSLADPRLKPLHDRSDFKVMAAMLPQMEAAAAR